MVSVDLPTAVVAVLVSVFLGFFKDNATEIIQYGLSERRRQRKEKIEWYREAKAICEEIVLFSSMIKSEFDAIQEVSSGRMDEIMTELNEIKMENVDDKADFVEKLQNVGDNIGFEVHDVPEQAISFNEENGGSTVNKYTIELKSQEEFAHYQEKVNDRIESEMYDYYKDLVTHFANRPSGVGENVFDAYTGLMIKCFFQDYEKDGYEEYHSELFELGGDLKDICDGEIERLDKDGTF
ncbi:hypothetical protein [Haloterrigena turkmenica]|uniref:hypothetical protein n=1 Tax=Haloterrigena turkmenica TaxID=62320 RepID=UPI0011D1145D|nr:hypothetical protein [Haloterrigena turkmenica]